METMLDVFNGDAFNAISLTDEINKVPFKPQRASLLGWEEEGVETTDIAISEMSGALAIVPSRPRGAPPTQYTDRGRKIRKLTVPHYPHGDTLMADEVQNVVGIGGSRLEGVQQKLNRKLAGMADNLDVTVEYQRMGALKGVILDSDGSTVIYDLFDEFDVSEQTTDIELSDDAADILGAGMDIAGQIEDSLGAATYTRLHGFAGKNFFKSLITHAMVRDAFRYYMATGYNIDPLKNVTPARYAGFTFAGVTWEQYRGSVGGIDFIDDDEARVFPIGVPGLFKTYYAPAPYIEFVNTIGVPRYAKQQRMDFDKGIQIESQTNSLSLVTRPDLLIKVTKS